MNLILFIIIGLIAGLIARAVMPGRQGMGMIATTILGMVGSLVGGLIGSLFSTGGDFLAIRPSGIILSIVGSLLVLFLIGYSGRRRAVV